MLRQPISTPKISYLRGAEKTLLQRNSALAGRICISLSLDDNPILALLGRDYTVDATITLHENGLGNLLGRSPAMHQVFGLIKRVAPTEATVMIMGESGVGKELVAECIHNMSHRAQGPLVAINCGSIPASLIEAELFGYEKGSFTGASRSHAGVFERATGGTLVSR